ncbi:hypothetical protein PoB_001616200 [Plakobranchus ocellatus]|uniref:Uncharacterized protein n=1 Tax=Plakobranchus ocellatus TaxID=259542 RepID=A0AAV3Z332_9GAST|nr:hypothetical protein PoB_001616200 [Plakobranchus ocellatus]
MPPSSVDRRRSLASRYCMARRMDTRNILPAVFMATLSSRQRISLRCLEAHPKRRHWPIPCIRTKYAKPFPLLTRTDGTQ